MRGEKPQFGIIAPFPRKSARVSRIKSPHNGHGSSRLYQNLKSTSENFHNVQDELILLNRARALEPEALEQIHDMYYVPIFRYISFRVNEHETAEDLTSEVFTRLLSALQDKTAPQKTIKGWLYSVASRVVKDFYRKKYRRKQIALEESVPSLADGPAKEVESMLTNENLRLAITELTEDQQEIIALRFGYEMSIRDVAQTTGKSEGAVKMLQARAVAALSRTMQSGGTN
jgi:RNA polymerase sigma-70 factor, ECF subfamily